MNLAPAFVWARNRVSGLSGIAAATLPVKHQHFPRDNLGDAPFLLAILEDPVL